MTAMPSVSSPVLDVRALTVSRRGDAGPLRVLDAIDLTVEAGTLTDVVGPSGAGKTTLLLALARLLPGVEGALAFRGRPASAIEPREWRIQVAYLPQRSALLPGTVGANLAVAVAAQGPHRGRRADRGRPARRSRPRAPDRRGARPRRRAPLRGAGGARRAAAHRAHGPSVLLLDEPDAALDEESAMQVGLLTREFVDAGGAVVRVRHLRSDGHADRRLRLSGGTLREES